MVVAVSMGKLKRVLLVQLYLGVSNVGKRVIQLGLCFICNQLGHVKVDYPRW